MRHYMITGISVLMCGAAFADPVGLTGAGWKQQSQGKSQLYTSPQGDEVAYVSDFDKMSPKAAIGLMALALAGQGCKSPQSDTFGRVEAVSCDGTDKEGVRTRAKVYAAANPDGNGTVIIAYTAPLEDAAALNRQKKGANQILSYLGASTTGGHTQTAQSSPAPAAQSPAQPTVPINVQTQAPKGKYRQGDVQHYLFDLSYTYGLGGMTGADYEPVAILKDGTALKLGDYALEDIDPAIIKRSDPDMVGTWRKSGNVFNVRWADGDDDELKMTVGPAFPWPSSTPLTGTFRAIGGGGNTAFGGSVLTFEVEDLTFYADGSFSQSNYRGGMTGISTNASRRGNAGLFSIDGSTLTLQYGNGKTVRTNLFFSGKGGSQGGAKQRNVLWIGSEDYRRKQG